MDLGSVANIWVLGGSIGYIVDGGTGAAIGLAITSGILFVLNLVSK